MDFVIDVLNYILFAILVGISGTWIFLIKAMNDSFNLTPYLDKFERKPHRNPKVSIILPARNEERHVGKCLDTLLDQDYENYEIIVINDSSEDDTEKIIKEFALKSTKITPVNARPKPEGWMGKNWACMEGYKKATGELLLFTDADTAHSKQVISLAVSHLLSLNLDALTVIPKILAMDFWTKVTLPMISTFLHTRFSATKVNNPSKKTGYFFGSFFIIKKRIYEDVGMHDGVKQEIIEDGALGKKVKEKCYKMRMVRGDHLIDAIWARDKKTLWNAIKRLMVPLYLQNNSIAVGIFCAVLFLLFMPFPFLAYSAISATSSWTFSILFATSLSSSILIYIGAVIEAKKGLGIPWYYALLGPIGSLVIILAFLSAMIQAKSSTAISWRGREYSLEKHAQNSISV